MTSVSGFLAAIVSRFSASFPQFSAKLPALIRLTRFDKPIGIYLLLWPTLTALWIAADGFPDVGLLIIFILGTTLMRAAGCAINDYADYKIDGEVERTVGRPLATGELKRQDAFYCFLVLCAAGFVLVLLTNALTILLSFGAVVVAAAYPFMKRFTHLPQLVLGIAFSFGILMAFSAQTNSVPSAVFLLFVANVVLTTAYDTQYAMVDREFDLKIGVKSTAILFGDADRVIIAVLQALFIIAMWFAGRQFEMGMIYNLGLLSTIAFFMYQHYLIHAREPSGCFAAFLNNNWVLVSLFAAVVMDTQFSV